MKILITGGTGHSGSVALEESIRTGDEVVASDNLMQGHRQAVHPEASFVEADLADRQRLEIALQSHNVPAVIHFAARSIASFSMGEPLRLLGGNAGNALNLLEAMASHGVRRFILSSTANVCGDPECIPSRDGHRLPPGSPYRQPKLVIERILHWCEVRCGLRYANLRYLDAAGASEACGDDHDPETHLIPW